VSTLASLLISSLVMGSAPSLEDDGADAVQVTPDKCVVEPISTPAAKPNHMFWMVRDEGSTIVPFRLLVAKDGSVADVRLLPGDYDTDAARETLKSVRSWRFKPLTCGGETGVWMQTTQTFRAPSDV